MVLLNILLGLLGLGIVILVHELGHFAAAKLSGIKVEAFSIGWGKVLFRKKINDTEYRISLFPVGGYCKMKGEEFFKQAENKEDGSPPVSQGSLFSVSPLRRAFTYFSGPLANLLFSILVLTIIWMAGFTIYTLDNKILLQSETIHSDGGQYPADYAGLRTGDEIVEIDGRSVENFRDIEQHVTPAADRELDMVVKRDGRLVKTTITPRLDTESGAGKIGVVAWIDPIVGAVASESTAERAGLLPGDRIVEFNGNPIINSIDLESALHDVPSVAKVVVERDGARKAIELGIEYNEDGSIKLGFSFETITYIERESNIFRAIGRGAAESISTLVLSVRSIGLLFRGVNMRSAVSGPIRITYFVGEVATRGFGQGLGRGLVILFRFLSMLSVALCFMNLLPIPALDGGFIIISVGEMLFRKPIRPRFFFRYQVVGFAIIFAILILTLFNDVFYLAGQ